MPFVSPAVVRAVVARAGEADVVIPRAGGQLQALHALYARACLPRIEERLREGRLKITGFFEQVSVREIPEEELGRLADPMRSFMNVNTPEELERARALAETQGEPGELRPTLPREGASRCGSETGTSSR
jgi:molybdopterin-guanine dinucleotide biosynthesis protein A